MTHEQPAEKENPMQKNSSPCSRRSFFTKSMAGLASFGILGLTKKTPIPGLADRTAQNPSAEPILRTLGRTGFKIPIVSMGVMNTFDSALLKRAYDLGMRHFDTAANYGLGRNESMVGQAIQELGARDKVVIATKVYIPEQQRNVPPEQLKKIFLNDTDESLKRLRTDHVDILYSHNVADLGYLNNPGVLEALRILKEQKKASFIGFSVHQNMTSLIQDAARSNAYDVILTSFNYAMGDDADLLTALRQAAAKGIGLVAMKTQCTQYWYRENLSKEMQTYYEGQILHKAVLKWVLRHDFINTAVPGFTNFQQLDDDAAVIRNLEYTPEEKQFLENRKARLSLGYCRQCGKCVATCPARAGIPDLMRTHMYAACYGNFEAARRTLKSAGEPGILEPCLSCTKCRAVCTERIDIPRRINELKTLWA
jgi:predicted aldo/keto reductase-like oxidoreductase